MWGYHYKNFEAGDLDGDGKVIPEDCLVLNWYTQHNGDTGLEDNWISHQIVIYPDGRIRWNFRFNNNLTGYYNMFSGAYSKNFLLIRAVSDIRNSGVSYLYNPNDTATYQSANSVYSENTITGNGFDGIHLEDSDFRTITDNNVTGNDIGLFLDPSTDLTITYNNFNGNTSAAMHNDQPDATIAENNYWGDSNATTIDALIWDNEEDGTDGAVDFEPFLGQAIVAGAPDTPTGLALTAGDSSTGISWNANTETDLSGYIIYWGTNASSLDNTQDVGNVTNYNLAGLNNDTTYYAAIAAYDLAGNISSPSEALAVTPQGSAEEVAENLVPTAPVLVFPGNGDEVSPFDINFIWEQATDDGTFTYSLFVCENSNFSTCPPYQLNADGTLISVYAAFSLYLLSLLGLGFLPIISRKKKLMSILLISLFLLSFIIGCGSKTAETASPSISDTQVSFSIAELKPNTTYYWKIVATDDADLAASSETWSFTTTD